MLTSITSEAGTSTGNPVSTVSAPPPVPLPTGPPSSAVDLSLKTAVTEVLDHGDMYSLENSLDNSHLLQVPAQTSSSCIHLPLSISHQVSVSMSETEPTSQPSVVVAITELPAESEVVPRGQMWSGGGEDKPEQLMAPDVQEEVSLLDEQTQ